VALIVVVVVVLLLSAGVSSPTQGQTTIP
jgi:hypothetical protein